MKFLISSKAFLFEFNLLVFLIFSTLLAEANADTPKLIIYQFLVTDSLDEKVPDGNYPITFMIFNDPIAGDTVWSESRFVAIIDGSASIVVGETVPIPDSVYQGSNMWLGFQFGSDPGLFPRKRLSTLINSLQNRTFSQRDTVRVKRTREGPRKYFVKQNYVISSVNIIEDTQWVETPQIKYEDGNVFVKKVVLPAGLLKRHFNVLWYANATNCLGCDSKNYAVFELKINGILAAKYAEKECSEIDRILELSFLRKGNNRDNKYIVNKLDTLGHSTIVTIDPSEEVVFSIIAYSFGELSNRSYSCVYDLEVGPLVIQFSGDTW